PAPAEAPKPAPAPKPLTPEERERFKGELSKLSGELAKVQGDKPLVHVCVDSQAVAEIVAAWTGIPVGRMVKDEIAAVLALRQNFENRVIGQSHALQALCERINTSRAVLSDPRRPIAVFL